MLDDAPVLFLEHLNFEDAFSFQQCVTHLFHSGLLNLGRQLRFLLRPLDDVVELLVENSDMALYGKHVLAGLIKPGKNVEDWFFELGEPLPQLLDLEALRFSLQDLSTNEIQPFIVAHLMPAFLLLCHHLGFELHESFPGLRLDLFQFYLLLFEFFLLPPHCYKLLVNILTEGIAQKELRLRLAAVLR